MVLISFVHLWIVAPFGREASAAVLTGGRVHFLMLTLSIGLSIATTAVVARAWGANNKEEASAATTSALALTCGVAAITGLLSTMLAPQIAGFFKLDAKTSALAVAYIRPLGLVNILFAAMITVTTALRSVGDVVRPLKFSAVATVVGSVSSYVLVDGALGFPALGVAGIPLGTAFGWFVVLAWFFYFWIRRKYTLYPVRSVMFEMDRIRQLARIGTPAAMEQILIQLSFILFMGLFSVYGTAAYAAFGMGITILSICIVVGLGFGTASATLAGQRLGAGDGKGAIEAAWSTMRLALVGMVAMAIITALLRVPLAEFLSTDKQVQEYTEFFIIILALIQPLMAIEFTIGGTLRGGGDTRYPMIVTFMGMIVSRLSLGAIVVHFGGTVHFMYMILMADYAVKSCMLVIRMRKGKWLESIDSDEPPLPLQSVAGVSRESVRRHSFKTDHKREE